MNQDQVKDALEAIYPAPKAFTVIFSGKTSGKVNGLYKPDTQEIIIHNRNFQDDNLLLYTAIHEYAHHIHACARGGHLASRAHTAEFWAIFHDLLARAEQAGSYRNVFAESPELTALTETIRREYLAENGSLVKGLGERLLQAQKLCAAIGARFEDYLDRVLRIPKSAATVAIKTFQYNLNPALGTDNLRFLAGIRNETVRNAAEHSLLNGKSPDTVRVEARQAQAGTPPGEAGARLKLEQERDRLERTIKSLTKRLEEIEAALRQENQQDARP